MLNKLKLILSLETVFAFRNTSCSLSTTSRSPEDNYELSGGQEREFQALGITLGRGEELGRHTSQSVKNAASIRMALGLGSSSAPCWP